MGQWLVKLIPCFPQKEKTEYKLFADDEAWRLNDEQLLSQLEEPDGFNFARGELAFHQGHRERLPTFDVDSEEQSIDGGTSAGYKLAHQDDSIRIRHRHGAYD